MSSDPNPTTLRAEEQRMREEEIAGWQIRVSSFRLGERWYCTVENIDPGARIARGEGGSRAEAEDIACGKAKERLMRTRTFPAP